MANLLELTTKIYTERFPLIAFFSISFIIAFLIPLFASFPTFNDMGGIFLRVSSVFLNLTPFTAAVIVFSTLFSLLFLSLAIVAINVIVKHSRTGTRIRKDVMDGLEKYTAKVFTVLLFYTIIVVFMQLIGYVYNFSSVVADIVALAVIPFFFYAPAAIVIDEQRFWRAINSSVTFFFNRFDYIFLWFVLSIVSLTLLDWIFISISGTIMSRYLLLVFTSLFVLPYLVVLQSQSYMSRFSLLKR